MMSAPSQRPFPGSGSGPCDVGTLDVRNRKKRELTTMTRKMAIGKRKESGRG